MTLFMVGRLNQFVPLLGTVSEKRFSCIRGVVTWGGQKSHGPVMFSLWRGYNMYMWWGTGYGGAQVNIYNLEIYHISEYVKVLLIKREWEPTIKDQIWKSQARSKWLWETPGYKCGNNSLYSNTLAYWYSIYLVRSFTNSMVDILFPGWLQWGEKRLNITTAAR